ncbi:hypothetical protein [Streptomyces sp. SPB074]|uniref:hypothetical protein n=1 Tax=Streptomyces sp. (strain SPB074) TaxID=465543 RepID=UPI00017F2903|nr:hypothetical protein [Streptomyces sp. SPB074]EFG64155.1 hypothetical protein SSBG_06659 [Streptomyces sp. SPB074]
MNLTNHLADALAAAAAVRVFGPDAVRLGKRALGAGVRLGAMELAEEQRARAAAVAAAGGDRMEGER